MTFANIPSELRELDRWVVWRWKDDPDGPGQRKKPPFVATDLRRHASSTDPATWSAFARAVSVVEAGRADGIGFALGLELGLVAVDLDEELPEVEQHAILLALDSYSERSPSGRGHHVIVKASLNGRGRHPAGIGVFQEARFFYCTGQHVRGTPTTIEERQEQLERVLAEYLPKAERGRGIASEKFTEAKRDRSGETREIVGAADEDDHELLERAFAARNGADFRRLWGGDTSDYASPSEAELALCGMLAFWTGPDPGRIDSLFRGSGLMRDKWERDDYRERTIATALEGRTEFYEPAAVPGTGEGVTSVTGTGSDSTSEGGIGSVGVTSVTSRSRATLAKPKQSAGGEPLEPLAWVRLSEIEMRSIVFLDPPLWQAAAFHLVVGRKGVGKGTVQADQAARVTRGELGQRRNVVWIASEDSASIDIKPRVVAAGGDPARIYLLTDWLQLPRDVTRLRETITGIGDVGLVIVDPVGNHITGKNSNSDTDIRDAIAPLNSLADELETMLVGIRHLTEKEAQNGAISAILGASAWVQVPRAVIAIARDNEDANLSHIQCLVGNRLPPGTPGRVFRIEGVKLDGLENEITRAAWIGDSGKNVETLIGGTTGGEEERSKSQTARELILDALEAAPGLTIESDELDAEITAKTGLAARTVQNVRGDLANDGLIRSVPEKDAASGLVQRWLVRRTNAPRSPDPHTSRSSSRSPDPVSSGAATGFGSTTPDPVQPPYTPPLREVDVSLQIPACADTRARARSEREADAQDPQRLCSTAQPARARRHRRRPRLPDHARRSRLRRPRHRTRGPRCARAASARRRGACTESGVTAELVARHNKSSSLTTLELARHRCPVDVMAAILAEEERRGYVERAGDGWRATPELVARHGAALGACEPA